MRLEEERRGPEIVIALIVILFILIFVIVRAILDLPLYHIIEIQGMPCISEWFALTCDWSQWQGE